MTNQQMHIFKCVFVENCHLECYYIMSSVQNTRCLETQKSAVLIYLLRKLQIVNLLVCHLSVPMYLALGFQTMQIMNHIPVNTKFWS